MDDDELRAFFALQRQQMAELMAAAKPAPAPSLTVKALYESFEASQKTTKSWVTTKYLLRLPIKEWGERACAQLRVTDWTALRTRIEAKYAGSTLNQILSWTKTLLRWGVDQGLLEGEPHICRAKPKKCKEGRETAPTEEDVQKMLDEAAGESESDKKRMVILAACDAGMRCSEIRQMQWSWIDRERMELELPNWACKAGSGGSTLLTQRLLDAIDSLPRDIRSPYVLRNEWGEVYTRQTLSFWVRELQRKAGLRAAPGEGRVHLHDIRGSFATDAIERGIPIEVVSAMLRHKSLEMTMRYVRRRKQRRHADLSAARVKFEAGIERDRTRR